MHMTQTAPFPGAFSTRTKRPAGGFILALLRRILTADPIYRARRHIERLPDYIFDDVGLTRDGASARPADRAALRW
jgi:uncharacterized protein YjiS (DUF1127 family)